MKNNFQSIDEYCASFSPEVQGHLRKIIDTFRKTCPSAQESIRYGMPAFKVGKDHLYVAANKNHIGIYPMYGLKEIESEIQPYRGKGTKDSLHLPYNRPMPLELIQRIIQIRSKIP